MQFFVCFLLSDKDTIVHRPKWPSSSFVSSDGLVTAMAYRLPHVVYIITLELVQYLSEINQICSKSDDGFD